MPSRAAAIASTPEPVPRSIRRRGAVRAISDSSRSRHPSVLGCCPVPKARPGSIAITRRPFAGGWSQGGAINRRLPTGSGRKWARQASAQSSLADALLEGAGEEGLREEGAKPRSTAGRLLLDDAERSQLPDEVRQALGRLLGNLDGELPVAGGRHRLSRRASSCVRGTLAPVVRARPSTRPRRPAAPRAASR